MIVRVLLADDQAMIRSGIAMLLASRPGVEVVGEVPDGAAAIEQARELQPDVVVMDVRMPRVDGVEATRAITADDFSKDPDRPVKVLVLTTYHVDAAVYGALRAGASGFLLKDAAPEHLHAAVQAVAAGDGWLDPAVTRNLLAEFAARQEPAARSPAELAELTRRETEVLVKVADGLSNSEIATALFIGEGTVKTHLGRVLTKLGLRDRSQAVAAAWRSGLMQGPNGAGPKTG